MRKKVRYVFLLLCAVLFVGGFFAYQYRQEIGVRVCVWKMDCLSKQLGATFSYEKAFSKEGSVMILNVKLIKAGTCLIEIPRSCLKADFSLQSHALKIALELDQARLELMKAPFDEIPIFPKLPFFDVTLDIVLPDLNLCLGEESLEGDFAVHVDDKGLKGHFIQSDLVLDFSKEKETVAICCDMDSAPLPVLSNALHLLFKPLLPKDLLDWTFQEGTGSGTFDICLEGRALSAFCADLTFEELKAENHTLSLTAHLEQMGALVHLCDKELPLHNCWDGEFKFEKGHLLLLGIGELTFPASTFIVKEGRVESSSLQGTFLGMEGSLAIDWLNPDRLMNMHFSGRAAQVMPLLPERFQESFATGFAQDTLHVDLSLRRDGVELALDGFLEIEEARNTHRLDFGCHFRSGQEEPHSSAEESVSLAMISSFKDQFGFSAKRVGWVRGQDFPIAKFVAPFFLKGMGIKGSGKISFEGIIDDRFLVLFYKGAHIGLENGHFSMDITEIGKDLFEEPVGVHYINLSTGHHIGMLPIQKATYKQKNYDLTFEHVSALLQIENNSIHLRQVDTKWEDLHFLGEVDVEVKSRSHIDITFSTQHVKGTATSTQNFLSHIVPSSYWEMPFDGNVESAEGGLFFHFVLQPKSKLVEGCVKGICQGNFSNRLCSVDKGQFTFDYDFAENRLTFSEGSGLIHPSKQAKGYFVEVPALTFRHFPNPEVSVSLSVARESAPLHIEGSIKPDEKGRRFAFEGNDCHLCGTYEDDLWNIDHFAWKQMEGCAQVTLEHALYKISNLHFQDGNKLHFDFDGSLDPVAGDVEGLINSLDVDLAEFASAGSLHQLLATWNPKGLLRGCGRLSGSLSSGEFDAITEASFQGVEGAGVLIGDGERLRCHYSTIHGLTIEGLELTVPGLDSARAYLDRFHSDVQAKNILLQGLDFSLPPDKIQLLADAANRVFPGKIKPDMVSWIQTLKPGEAIDGKINIEVCPGTVLVQLDLKEGTYVLGGKKVDLKDFSLRYENEALLASALLSYNANDYHVQLQIENETPDSGRLTIHDPKNPSDQIIAKVVKKEASHWEIREVFGTLGGLDVQLLTHGKCLKGIVYFDGPALHKLLPVGFKTALDKLALGSGYLLDGEFYIPPTGFRDLSFSGKLLGENCELRDVTLAKLESLICWTPNSFEMSKLTIQDWAGKLEVPKLQILKNDQVWDLTIPSVEVSNLRFSRLHKESAEKTKRGKSFLRSLFLSSFTLQGFQGTLGDPESFRGRGLFHFTNVPRKTLISNLLLIPTEITARIGLDLSLLVPVRGEINYEIGGGKIFLTDFTNMYSEGKRSRFYLAEGFPATVDFEGNLNLKVKMKQYNLLMKLAEFFTVTVKGTLLKPTYTFLNQIDEEVVADED